MSESPEISALWQKAGQHQARGETQQAINTCNKILEINPGHRGSLLFFVRLAISMQKYVRAMEILDRLLEHHPPDDQLMTIRGDIYSHMGKWKEAADTYAPLYDRNPNCFFPYLTALEHTGKTGTVIELVAPLKGTNDYTPGIATLEAQCLRREGKTGEALETLLPFSTATGSVEAKRLHFELGRLYDRLGQPDEAFHHFTLGNNIARELKGPEKCSFMNQIDMLSRQFTPEWTAGWAPWEPEDPINMVFLFGFTRSGTTLMDQVLDAHPNAQVMEETAASAEAINVLAQNLGKQFPAGMDKLDPEILRLARKHYLKQVNFWIGYDPDKILVDKFPLNLAYAGLLKRIFPEAKIILSLRHPIDTCLSSFMQDFNVQGDNAMSLFLSLEDSVRLYEAIFSLWNIYTRCLELEVHTIKYEAMVQNFETEIAAVLNFLGLEYLDQLKDFHQHAEKRGTVRTASYHQVTEPLYNSAVYRWEKYRHLLGNAEETLAPFIKQFGYDK